MILLSLIAMLCKRNNGEKSSIKLLLADEWFAKMIPWGLRRWIPL